MNRFDIARTSTDSELEIHLPEIKNFLINFIQNNKEIKEVFDDMMGLWYVIHVISRDSKIYDKQYNWCVSLQKSKGCHTDTMIKLFNNEDDKELDTLLKPLIEVLSEDIHSVSHTGYIDQLNMDQYSMDQYLMDN